MADKYMRVRKEQDKLPENEIRVRKGVGIGRYLRRAHDLLSGKVAGQDSVVIKGVSNAMESAVKLAELIKHRVKGLHQLNLIENLTIVDEYEPLEEGLDYLKFERQVTMFTVTLSQKEMDHKDIGYQLPIPESEVMEYDETTFDERPRGPREEGRRPPRGGLRRGFRGRNEGRPYREHYGEEEE